MSKKPTLKEKYQMLRAAGYSSKEAEKLRNRSIDNVTRLIKDKTKQTEKERKQQRAKENYKRLKEKGLSTKDAARLRYASDQTIKEILKTGKAPAKGRRRAVTTGGKMLVMLWRDKTEFVDDTPLQNVKQELSHESTDYLIKSINGYRSYTGGEIGDHKIEVTTNPETVISYYRDEWYPIYSGNATQYKKFLVSVNAMVAGLYQPFEKEMFLFELAMALNEVNPKAAARFVNDFQLY